MEKIGAAIITFKRFWSFKRVFDSIPLNKIDHLVIINGTPEEENKEYTEFFNTYFKEPHQNSHKVKVINSPGKCVGINKNVAFEHLLMNPELKHLFIIENDIEIMNPFVFEKYIDTAKKSGLPHLMFGYHGVNNLNPDGSPRPMKKMDYGNTTVWWNGGCVGAFNYYERNCLLRVGLMDERYTNANEHISHTYRYVQFGFLPAYKWYPDIENSHLYLKETASPTESTTIPITDENIRKNGALFKESHMPPNEPRVGFPDYPMTIENVVARCKTIKGRGLV